MALEMRKTSKWWYGRYKLNGKVHCQNLRVAIAGKRPASITEPGNATFEQSKGVAQDRLDVIVKEAKEKRDSEEYVQQLHEIRTGRRIDSIPLLDFAKAWDRAPRKRKGSERYVKQAHSLFNRFVKFVAENHPDAETLADISPAIAEDFLRAEQKRQISPRTWNVALILLRSAFKALARRANISRNPFVGIPTMDETTVHRRPFTQEEIEAITKATAGEHAFIRPVVVTGICTAMRRGDCCTLRWEDVDLDERFVRVKTSKTGETVEIPMFAALEDELRKHLGNGSEYVFPELATMYQKNPQGVTYRVRNLFEAAGFYDVPEDDEEEKKKKKESPTEKKRRETQEARRKLRELEPVERDKEVKTWFKSATAGISDRTRGNMKRAYALYCETKALWTVAEKMEMSKSSIWKYLNAIEFGADVLVMPLQEKDRPKQIGAVSRKREGSKRRASIRDFHSFRVTWITLALSAGVPLELVQRVTGHRTTDVVLKHYFKPGREDFRKSIEDAMPKMLVSPSGQKSEGGGPRVVAEKPAEYLGEGSDGPSEWLEKALEALKNVSGKANQTRAAEAVEMILKAREWYDSHVMRETA